MNGKSKKRYSRQRESILDILKNTTAHPTANSVYDSVRCEIPNISLGTVYRNLSELVSSGDIIKIEAGDGSEHYDFRTETHSHLICEKCGAVFDIFIDLDKELDRQAEKFFDGSVLSHNLVFKGLCKKCLEKD